MLFRRMISFPVLDKHSYRVLMPAKCYRGSSALPGLALVRRLPRRQSKRLIAPLSRLGSNLCASSRSSWTASASFPSGLLLAPIWLAGPFVDLLVKILLKTSGGSVFGLLASFLLTAEMLQTSSFLQSCV